MIRIIRASETPFEQFKTPELQTDNAVDAVVDAIIRDVRARGDAALIDFAARFDRADISAGVLVTQAEIDAAFDAADPALIAALASARTNIEAFHRRQIRQSFVIADQPGITLGQRIIPLNRVGLYVPGGTAAYPSSVLMNAVPAKLAGVGELIMTTPPGADGRVAAPILVAAKVAGVDKIIKSGGAQAIAALAYGTESVPQVDKIVGPGNMYVATAKRKVYGRVDIEMIAGPSEILIIADGKSNPAHAAADLLGQAEHDEHASAILLTDCEAFAARVSAEIESQIQCLSRRDIARKSIDINGRIVLVKDMAEALAISNRIAPEHLELMVDDPFALLGGVTNAGSVFLGRYAPEALGDYWAGPNHTLPTSGTARFSSPLSVDDFVKKSQFIHYTRDALAKAVDGIATLAESEGLTAHARSAKIRFEEAGE